MAKKKGPADHEVGYGKPPKHTQFRAGQSGNPKGRPKGVRNLKTDLLEELGERILVREGERARKVSKQRAIVKTMVTRTLKGDGRATGQLLEMIMRLLDHDEGSGASARPLEAADIEILETYKSQLMRDVGEAAIPETSEGAAES